MSVFRPCARVTAPDGREWEIYAYRFRLRRRGATFDPALAPDDPVGVGWTQPEAAGAALDGVLWLLGLVPRLLVRVVWDLPRGALGTVGSDAWTIEAVTWQPHRTSYTWTTTREFRRNVAAQVEGQLARGLVPKSTRATYLGAS